MKTRITIWLATLLIVLVAAGRAKAQDCYQSSILSPSPFLGNNGVAISYSYQGKDGGHVGKVDISPLDFGYNA